jgi:hypothetical protein
MRKTLNRIGAILIIFVAICVLVGAISNSVHEKYNEKRKIIIKQCEVALPILTRRYQAFVPLLELCEKQDNWNDNFEIYKNVAPPAFMAPESQPSDAETEDENNDDIRRFTGRIIVAKSVIINRDYDISYLDAQAFGPATQVVETVKDSGVRGDVVIDFTTLRDGISHFTGGATAFEKVMGATEIEPNLPQIITVATNIDMINTNELMLQLKSGLAATDPAASAALSAVSQSVEQYNSDIAHSIIAKMMTIPPININSQLITWDKDNPPN